MNDDIDTTAAYIAKRALLRSSKAAREEFAKTATDELQVAVELLRQTPLTASDCVRARTHLEFARTTIQRLERALR